MRCEVKVLSAVMGAVMLSGCGAPVPVSAPSGHGESVISAMASPLPAGTSAPNKAAGDDGDIIAQMEALYDKLDSSRLPVDRTWIRLLDETEQEDLPPQLFFDEAEAYRLSQAIRNLMSGPHQLGLRDFESIDEAYKPSLLEAALFHTQPIIFGIETSSEDIFKFTPKNHVLGMLVKREIESGRWPSELFYEDDVQSVMDYLYGEGVDFFGNNVNKPYYYYEREHVFSRVGDYGGPYWGYPQITNYTKTDEGYECETVIVSALDKNEPMYGDDHEVALTKENFEENTALSAKYRFAFREAPDGHLQLSSFKTLRKAAEE